MLFSHSAPGESAPERPIEKPSTESKSESLVRFQSDAGVGVYGSVISQQGAVMGNDKSGRSLQGTAGFAASSGYSQVSDELLHNSFECWNFLYKI